MLPHSGWKSGNFYLKKIPRLTHRTGLLKAVLKKEDRQHWDRRWCMGSALQALIQSGVSAAGTGRGLLYAQCQKLSLKCHKDPELLHCALAHEKVMQTNMKLPSVMIRKKAIPEVLWEFFFFCLRAPYILEG